MEGNEMEGNEMEEHEMEEHEMEEHAKTKRRAAGEKPKGQMNEQREALEEHDASTQTGAFTALTQVCTHTKPVCHKPACLSAKDDMRVHRERSAESNSTSHSGVGSQQFCSWIRFRHKLPAELDARYRSLFHYN
ncbi:hypothetical protein EYF80_018651 [Liparis tanakae]|uniref:Uncharacterized protein n=1 Tax=Liparis tanakae TaxID=230148 RepID=A0A4Z2HZY5_9TELE|nr:hypothetical protein EYF80_018651 [Liparis tanakae]